MHAHFREPIDMAAVAAEAGFYDQSVFTRSFKEVTGQTPARYRRQHLAEWAQRTAP